METDKEKLTLKELVGYLPYSLKWCIKDVYGELSVDEMNGAFEDVITLKNSGDWYLDGENYHAMFNAKPLLRPLSDLTNDTYDFIYNTETDYPSIEQFITLDAESRLSQKFSYIFWQLLYKNHFDIFGLIERNLAINLNDLPNE